MPLASPTINSITDIGEGYLLVNYTNTGTGDHNELWRVALDEYDGEEIKIIDPVPWNTAVGFVRDYGAASGKDYTYRLVSVDGASTESSATVSASLSLSTVWLHSIVNAEVEGGSGDILLEDGGGILLEDGGGLLMEGVVMANGTLVLQLTDQAPHSRSYALASIARAVGNSSLPLVGIGSIEQIQISPPALIVYGNEDRNTLRSIYRSPYYACLRDGLGNKWLGRLMPPEERYGATYADIGFVFDVLDASEAVA